MAKCRLQFFIKQKLKNADDATQRKRGRERAEDRLW